jgi:hypothetical protein
MKDELTLKSKPARSPADIALTLERLITAAKCFAGEKAEVAFSPADLVQWVKILRSETLKRRRSGLIDGFVMGFGAAMLLAGLAKCLHG